MTLNKTVDRGIDLIAEVCEYLNGVITSTRKQLDRNDKTLWGEYLHVWTNDEWTCIFEAFDYICDRQGIFLDEQDQKAMDNARFNLKAYAKHTERAMDIRRDTKISKRLGVSTQGQTWHALMVIREIYSQVLGTNCDNRDGEAETPQNTLFL